MDELVDKLTQEIEKATRELSDEDYVDTLERISENLLMSVEAKREEMDEDD